MGLDVRVVEEEGPIAVRFEELHLFGDEPLVIPNPRRFEYENVLTREATHARRIVVAPGEIVLMRRR